MLREDLALATRRVVLLELGDLVEQLRAALVVEPLGWELFRKTREPSSDICAEGCVEVGSGEEGIDAHVTHQASLAQRKPEMLWRRMGYSQLRNVVSSAAG